MLTTFEEETATTSVKDQAPQPVVALIFYGKENESTFVGVTRHNVTGGRIQEGKYINPMEVKSLLKTDEESTLELKPHNIIAENEHYLLWLSKSRLQTMWFRIGAKQYSPMVHWTPLLFIVNKKTNRLNVFAVESDVHPTKDTIIYHAPLMNIGCNGDVCQGSARLPAALGYATIPEIEATIYESNFTHVNHQQTVKVQGKPSICSNEHLKFWQRKARTKTKVTSRSLVQYKTLSDLLDSLN